MPQRIVENFRALSVALSCVMVLASCGEPKSVIQARAALAEREATVQKNERRIAEKEHALDQEKIALKAQQEELEKLKAQVADELTKAKLLRESIASAARRGPAPSVTADRVIVIDPQTDEVLFEKNADKRGQVASTQKLLTANLLATAGDWDRMVTVEAKDIDCAPVKIGLKIGDSYSRRQLLTALLVHSFNDIAQALARDNAGSLEKFVVKMNERAAQLGMADSHFTNPHGLPDDAQFSTARDMAKIAKADDAVPELREMFATKQFVFQKNDGKSITLENTNRVLLQYPNCDGMKTGYTQAAGYCLICSGEKNGKRRVCVVLNDTHLNVWKDARALLEWSLRG